MSNNTNYLVLRRGIKPLRFANVGRAVYFAVETDGVVFDLHAWRGKLPQFKVMHFDTVENTVHLHDPYVTIMDHSNKVLFKEKL